jgi:hypothetical protein
MTPSPRRGGIAGPILLIGLGALLLLSNFGRLPESIWPTLLRMWPVVLIAFGLDILITRRSVWGSMALVVLILAVLAGGYWLSTVTVGPIGPGSIESVAVPREGATQAGVRVRSSVGLLEVEPGSAGATLLQATIPLLPGESLGQDVDRSGGSLDVDLHSEGVFVLPSVSARGQPWEVRLHPDVPTALALDLGAGEIRLDGELLTVTSVDANLGVGVITLEVGSEVRSVEADSGIGQIVIVLPAGVPARIDAEVALGDVDVPAGYTKSGDVYLSPGWTASSASIEVKANQAIGQIVVRQAR